MEYYNEASLVDSADGIQFKVYSSSHPNGFIIAKPKYVPDVLMHFKGLRKRFLFSKSMYRFNVFNDKKIVENNLNEIRKNFQENRDRLIDQITEDKVMKFLIERAKVKEISE